MKTNTNHINSFSLFVVSILIATSLSMESRACPPPPDCDLPERYAMWAKQGTNILARSENNENVYLDYFDAPHDVTFELYPQISVGGVWQTWYWDPYTCGFCTYVTPLWGTTGGQSIEENALYKKMRYSTIGEHSITGTHQGYNCVLNGNDYFIPGGMATMKIYVINVDVTSASIPDDQICVELQPGSATLDYMLLLEGPGGNHTIKSETSKSGGSYTESFNIPNLAEGTYQLVTALWYNDDFLAFDSVDYNIEVIGTSKITRYGLMDESQCTSGGQKTFEYTDGVDCINVSSCTILDASCQTQWWNWITDPDYGANGSGRKSSGDHYTRESYCSGGSMTVLREIGGTAGCPSCSNPNDYLTANQTVARNTGASPLNCGDVVYLHGHGRRTVTDSGIGPDLDAVPNRNRKYWLDNFSGYLPCSVTTDLGNMMVIHLKDE